MGDHCLFGHGIITLSLHDGGVSKGFLRAMAALTWYIGSVALIAKAWDLLMAAQAISLADIWSWAVIGIVVGWIKAGFIFNRSCHKNLERINALDNPRFWQFFRPRFFFFLALMILAGTLMSRMAAGHYPLLIFVAVLDLSIGTALLISSHTFWKSR